MHTLLSALGVLGSLIGLLIGAVSLQGGSVLYTLGAVALVAMAGLFLVLSVADLGVHLRKRRLSP